MAGNEPLITNKPSSTYICALPDYLPTNSLHI
uniref:Uncharacterized protein n=1 Tax=Arundo donax TaxID=35708 RepID=A0A0A9HMR0_ARUDO